MTEHSAPWQPEGARVVVTGAGGFIGSHLTEALVGVGARVRALVHYNAQGSVGALAHASPAVLDDVEIVAGDVRDPFAVRGLLRGADAVFHLAALIGIPYSYVAPASYVATNVEGTLNVLEAARAEGLRRIVVTSTSETYGTAQYVPIDERHPLVAQSPYAASKIAADQLALSYWRSFDVPVVVVRPFNTFGPRQSERAILPTIVSQALRRPGTPIALGSLSPRRDLTFVKDTASGFLTLARHPDAMGRVTNLGTGSARSVGEMVKAVGRVLGRSLEVQEDAQRVRPTASEVMELVADASAARAMGWEPKTSFDAGLEAVVEYMRNAAGRQDALQRGYRT